ncbi:MAG: hypothetical protein HGA44_11685 [Cellulomonadaceae bacterium]|nr:hypothetical protein [Cellulomonadaceae bacterium]
MGRKRERPGLRQVGAEPVLKSVEGQAISFLERLDSVDKLARVERALNAI